ncbi:myotubularin-related protein 13-like isoform X2 [Orbicella faveolata]|uniref:myotubularin-related protein 13-like isoform X2 n=1 Tax=Orbicella faveolata TaxID=48498 RepID=UPI0009E351C9|nr:myotubularin-related protein 13-like isoform X2 [Orbicella faveolata]
MSRLADYFVVCGIDRDSKNEVKGKVIQRFPSKDRKDATFPEGLELFCQPGGWNYSYYYKPPTFFVAVLTDMEGEHRYCACFTFYEKCIPTKSKSRAVKSTSREGFKDGSQSDSSLSDKRFSDDIPGISVNSEELSVDMFAPKCLCLVSRASYFDILKSCLTTIYWSFLSGNSKSLEGLVGCVLGFVQVPPPGGPRMTFSMGAGDRQTLSPPASETLPVTGKSVSILFNQLGIHNMLSLFSAALTENKILFYSSSYSQLTHATQSMLALMYPLKFSYVFIPILPSALLEFLSAPTPYIMGVHESYKDTLAPDLADVILVDIDGGHLSIPDSINLPYLPEPFLSRARHELTLVLHPQLVTADHAFQSPTSPSLPVLQDKELRAVFIRLLAQLLSGYRSCLRLIRIHPKPVITFNKVSFLEFRGMVGDAFLSKVLESISFLSFVANRGPPYRTCDLFDQLCVEIDSILINEGGNDAEVQANIQQLAQKLYDNEPSCDAAENNAQPVVSPEEAELYSKMVFPTLKETDISRYINQQENMASDYTVNRAGPCVVPSNPMSSRQQHYMYIPSRKLEVLRDCVDYIFENKISEARKTLPSVVRALKSKGAQLALCHELSLRAKQHRSVLEHDQFDLVVRLLNSALQDDASMSNTAVAAALLPLTATFCRKLNAGVIQFAYTCVQDHPVWERQQFWEEAFYADVESQIQQLYVDEEAPKANAEETLDGKEQRTSRSSLTPVTKHRSFTKSRDNLSLSPRDSGSSGDVEQSSQAVQKPVPSALSIAAKQLKKWPDYSKEEKDSLINSEEGIVYSQAIHYANRMVYMRIPLDASEKMPAPTPAATLVDGDGDRSVNGTYTGSIVNGVAGGSSEVGSCITDNGGWEIYMDDEDGGTIADQVTRFVSRFVDRVGTEAGISQEHLKSLYTMIPGVVAMHIESLEPVYREYKNLAPIQKAKIMRPALLQGEEMLSDGLRAYLIPDGRELGRGGEDQGGPCLLPADGAVFLTNYRVIFKGTPVDPFASEMIVTRSFPVGSLIKEKKIGVQYLQHLEQWLHECIQLRSSTFQMLKLVFDEEVDQESIETFRKKLQKRHAPNTVFGTFAFCGKGIARTPTFVIQKHMERQGTLKKTKKKIVSASRHKASSIAHIRGSIRKRRHRHNLSDASSLDQQRSPSGSLTTDDDDSVQDINDISLKVEPVVVHGAERLSKLSYCGDYSRLKLGNIAKDSSIGPWRICMVNVTYTACRSYPSVVVVPQSISDDSILRIAKNHRQGRFPVAVWRHQRNKATLLRAGSIERSTIGSIMRQHKTVGGTSVASHAISSSASVEQEKYLAAVVAATPQGKNKQIARANSLHLGVILRDGYFADDVDSGQLVDRTIMKKGWEPAALYIFGDKTLLRHVKQEAYPKCEFVPIELPDIRAVRASFKKFQRATCPSTETNLSFIQQVEESEWLQQLSAIMTVANCLVDLIDIQGSSVLVCFEDGWDTTPQVLSLAEIMLDPHYRTIDGFKLLIEKEWLSFGHRFTHRGCQIASAQAGFTPIFLQFLDCVHQIMLQFPLSFEFNDHFLSTIAYHHVSMRFRTFLLDSEHERSESGWMAEEDHKPRGKSLWDYMDLQKSKSPLYNNFLFSPNQHKVLRPFCKVPNLKVWKYFTTENLSTGPTYDLELINDVTTTTENEQSVDGKQETYGSCMTGCYGDVTQFNNDECSWLLQELYRLEEEADQKPKKWEQHWHKLSYPSTKRTHFPVNTRWFSSQRLMLHKRSTMEVILKGKLQVEERGAQGFSQPHNFVPHLFVPPSNCDHCYQMIIGILNRGAKCTECGYNCHERCQPQVPWQCKKRELPEQPGSGVTKSTLSLPSETDAGHTKKLHCGHLYKRGHLLRQWKARWFVLDTQRNQLRYYDGEHDEHLQGYVDLGEMIAVQALNNVPPGAPKGSEKGAFFDLRTTKRVYNLMCQSRREAEVWVEKLQNMNV